MTYDDAFLRAILKDPDDDTSRLIYADWLEEHGDPRGEFIRIQCALAAMSAEDTQRSLLEQYERELLARHQDTWLGGMRPLLSGWKFRRGFLDTISVPAATYLRLPAIPHPATVRRLEVDLAGFEPPQYIVEFVPESVARENVALPIGTRGGTLVIAAREPHEVEILLKLQFILNRDIELVAADGEQVVEAINRLYGSLEGESVEMICTLGYVESPIEFEMEAVDGDSPVARLVTLFILEAQSLRADQIRIQPRTESIQVLYRIEQKWVERDHPPKRLLAGIVARIRALADLPFVDESVAQIGHMRATSRGIPLARLMHF